MGCQCGSLGLNFVHPATGRKFKQVVWKVTPTPCSLRDDGVFSYWVIMPLAPGMLHPLLSSGILAPPRLNSAFLALKVADDVTTTSNPIAFLRFHLRTR